MEIKRISLTIIKTVTATALITFILMLAVALSLYKFNLNDKYIDVMIVIIYVIANFVGGFIIGKVQESRRLIWGSVLGLTYFIVLVFLSLLVVGALSPAGCVIAFFACVLGGAAGAFIS